MEFICKPKYVLTADERAAVLGMASANKFTQKQKDVLTGIARRWPERWYRGRKRYYETIYEIACGPLFLYGRQQEADYMYQIANWAKAFPHVVLALSQAAMIGEDAPAPVDWAKECERLITLREKAIAYITEHTESSFYVYSGADIVYAQTDRKRMITVGWDGEDSDEAETEEVEDLDLAVLIDLCTVIQKALAAGGQQP